MFKLTQERLVKDWPATIHLPADGGKVVEENITLDLLILDADAAFKLLNGDEPTFKKVIKGWTGIGDADGNALPFSEENLNLVLKSSFFVIAAARAYQQASSGQAAEKNS